MRISLFVHLVWIAAGVVIFRRSDFVHSANLGQFGLPPCCYPDMSLLPLPSETKDVLDVKGQKREGKSLQAIDEAGSSDDVKQAAGAKIQSFLFPMDVKTESINVKLKRTANYSSAAEGEADVDTDLTLRSDDADNEAPNADSEAPDIDSKEVEAESDLKTSENEAIRQMPSDWRTRLRRVLFQSIKNQVAEGAKNKSGKAKVLWEKIYEAPLQAIAASTRREIPADETLLTSLGVISHPNERISGVMVNTEQGIELRMSEFIDPSVSESNQVPSTACDCHLIHHGDTLLAYWSVGFSGNNLEYLVYPVPHNVPTPPIFEPFQAVPIIRPSPIDLNPLIMSRSTDDVPFQPSLEFGIAAASQYSSRRPRYEPAQGNGISYGLQFQQDQNGIPAGIGGFPGGPIENGFTNGGPIGNGLQFQQVGNVGFPGGPIGNGFTNGGGVPFGIGPVLPNFGFSAPNSNFLPNQNAQIQPNFFAGAGFGGYPQQQPYPALMYMPPAPVPQQPQLTHRKEDELFQNQPPGKVFDGNGIAIGPLDPFNPNHPKSIQEILFGYPGGGNYLPPSLPNTPPLAPPPDGYEDLPPGPNPGVYTPEIEQYPRNRPLRNNDIPTRTQQNYENDPGRGQYFQDLDNRWNRPEGHNENDRDRPGYSRDSDDCFRTKSNNCLRRYGDGQETYGGRRAHSAYQGISSNSQNKRSGRKLNSKTTEASYVLDF